MNYEIVLTTRISKKDFEKVNRICEREGLSRSEYFRNIVRMAVANDGWAESGGVLLDGKSIRRMKRELVRWGHHYNQGVYALNYIKYQLGHGRCDLGIIGKKLDEATVLLSKVEEGRQSLHNQIEDLKERTIMGND